MAAVSILNQMRCCGPVYFHKALPGANGSIAWIEYLQQEETPLWELSETRPDS